MSDDIDIVNHELIDNPQVKHVFPHFDDIKQEILDYGVDVPTKPSKGHDDVVIEHVTGTLMPKSAGVIVKDEPSKLGDSVIFLDDSDDDIDLKPILPTTTTEDDQDNEDAVICTNKIILGSKKSNDVIHNCRECNIFFDSKTKLDCHNKLKHNTVGNKVTLGKKSNLKSIFNDINYDSNDDFENNIIVGLYDSNDDSEYHLCFHCDEKFNSKQDVVDHLYRVINRKDNQIFNKNIASKKQAYKRTELNKKRKIEQVENNSKINKTESNSKRKTFVYDLKKCYVVVDKEIKAKKNKVKEYNLKKCSVVLKKLNIDTIDAYLKKNDEIGEEMEVIKSNDSNNDDFSSSSDYNSKLDSDSLDDEDLNDDDDYEEDEEDDDKKTGNNKSKSQLNENEIGDKYKKFYKCILCTCYFSNKNKIAYEKHMKTNHNIKTPKINTKSVFNPYCTFCDVKSESVAEYNLHIKQNTSTHMNKTYDLNDFEYYIYRCLICNDEFSSKCMLYKHKVRKHDTLKRGFITEIITNKEYFDKILIKDSPEVFSSITAYGGLNPPIPKGVLFRCALCSCHFINGRAAKVHYGKCLKGQGSNKYRCKKCNLDINKVIRDLHSRQHEWTDEFKVYDVDKNRDSFLDRLLCLCPKCGVNYGEVRFWKHYPLCGENPPESKYCVKCDILVDGTNNQIKTHEVKHKTVKEFFIVEYIETGQNVDVKHEETKAKEKVIQKNYLLLYYCKNCKCFVRNAGGRQFLAHSENRCKKLPKKMCQDCGLVTTQRAYTTHKLQHKWTDLNLLDYTFYDFFTNKCIDPPFPQFPYCKECDTYFEDINIILQHKCDEMNRKICESCNKKFTAHAHKLHMFYHDYRVKKKNRLKIYAKNIYLKKVTKSDNELKVKKRDSVSKQNEDIKELNTVNGIPNHVLYKCMNCELVVDKTKALLHKKINDCNSLASNYKSCPECQLKLLKNDLNQHIEKHNINPTFTNNNIKFIYFNKVNDDVDISEESADEIDTSDTEKKYKLYHCVCCKNCFSDIDEVNQHVCTSNAKQCMYCRLLFPLQTINKHVKDHERYKDMTKNNIKLIIFDANKEDKFDSNLTILMRNYYVSDEDDDVIDTEDDKFDERVDKTVENDTSANKNDLVTKTQDDNESIIIKKEDATKTDKTLHKNKMSDKLFKYKLLQCKTCHLNFTEKRIANKHDCSTKVTWNECGYCNNLFNDSEYAVHMQYHNFDKDMTQNIIIKYFDVKKETVLQRELQYDTASNNDIQSQNQMDDVVIVESNKNISIVINVEDFDTNKMDNANKTDSSNENNIEKIYSIQVNKSKEKVLCGTNKKKNAIDTENSNQNADIEKNTTKQRIGKNDKESKPNKTIVNIYKCECALHFLNLNIASKHTFECKTARIAKQICTKCKLNFTPADLFTHIVEHHGNKTNLFDIKILNLTDVKVTDAIFKCHSCELLFTTKTHLYRHYKTCQDGDIRKKVNCDKCGFDFYYNCYALHRKKHHSSGADLSADQLNVEVINKVDVPKSYFKKARQN